MLVVLVVVVVEVVPEPPEPPWADKYGLYESKNYSTNLEEYRLGCTSLSLMSVRAARARLRQERDCGHNQRHCRGKES